MGFFDKFKKAAAPAKPATPSAIEAAAAADVVCAPVSGKAIRMADVPDPVFSGEVMGKGCAVWPEGDVVYAPISGTVSAAMGHAVGIAGDDGVEVLVHIGVDTVEMNGKGFTAYAKQGDHVCAGDPCIGIDRAAIKEAGHPDCVVVIVTNSDDYASVEMAVEPETNVSAGAALVKVAK